MARTTSSSLRQATRVTVVHPYAWAWEPLEADSTFVLRPMFGTKAAYVGGKLALCFSARREPWHGVLVATDHCHHESLRHEFSNLLPHPILPKWLYLPDASPRFEATVTKLVEAVRRRDPRIGIEPKPRRARSESRGPRAASVRPKAKSR
jgi:hypothetical protein